MWVCSKRCWLTNTHTHSRTIVYTMHICDYLRCERAHRKWFKKKNKNKWNGGLKRFEKNGCNGTILTHLWVQNQPYHVAICGQPRGPEYPYNTTYNSVLCALRMHVLCISHTSHKVFTHTHTPYAHIEAFECVHTQTSCTQMFSWIVRIWWIGEAWDGIISLCIASN